MRTEGSEYGNTKDSGWGIPVCTDRLGYRACKLHNTDKACRGTSGLEKATSYTVLRKLCEKGILRNENATVTALVKKEAVCRQESEQLLHRSFGNSLPAFVASFLQDKKLTQQEAEELKRLIDAASLGGDEKENNS